MYDLRCDFQYYANKYILQTLLQKVDTTLIRYVYVGDNYSPE
jgi:hypothetical protein